MLEYIRIDILEGIDVNKTNASKECDIFHYCSFLDKDFQYELNLCNGCYELIQKSNFNDIAIVSVKGNDYRIHYWYINCLFRTLLVHNGTNLLKNYDLNEKSGFL